MAEKQQQTTTINSWTMPESNDICQPLHVLHLWYVGERETLVATFAELCLLPEIRQHLGNTYVLMCRRVIKSAGRHTIQPDATRLCLIVVLCYKKC